MPVNNETSRGFQERFAAEIPAVVEGKPISKVKVGKLASSSGTNIGFNNAIDLIKHRPRNGNLSRQRGEVKD